ncbi:ATP-grasp domain-containing protein [Paraclostridium sordellii]|uniref:ATP-grasp domain-containing protein n=1 Tax=Paraclostridium sordellii TaxID=1505 RepID=UPI0005E53A2E|nr:ATP-grasp domain-containing protein [Paeniclostridium sordellii]CEP81815.1 carbamoyl-phosphate-synthetase [[Clostridium] sordellii] [Paeniclostridium sordellii]
MNRILILGVASVQMDAVLQLKKMGVEVHTCAMAKDGPAAEVSDYFKILNFMEIDKVEEYIVENNIDCIYSIGSDIAMPIASKISGKLNLPHFVREDSARICNNKNLLREFLGNDFKGNIKFEVVKDEKHNIGIKYPFIMKPTDSQGQRGVKIINSYDEFIKEYPLSKTYSRSGLVIIEEYIKGNEISVNAYLIDGKVVFCVPSDRVTWPGFGAGLIHKHIVPCRDLSKRGKKNIYDLVSRSAEKLNVKNGPLYFQIKMDGDSPKIIEITPRLDGCHMWKVLEYYTGTNLLKLTLEHLLFNKTSSLEIQKNLIDEVTLEFICQKPNSIADYSRFNIPKDALDVFYYYNDGDNIRPVNGKFDKIGYFITKKGIN